MNIIGIVIFLLILWAVLSIAGFLIEGLFWLAVIGIILFIATAIWGFIKRNTSAGGTAAPEGSEQFTSRRRLIWRWREFLCTTADWILQ